MKTYYVIRIYSTFSPDVVFTTKNRKDADGYASIMANNDLKHTYAVCELIATFPPLPFEQ